MSLAQDPYDPIGDGVLWNRVWRMAGAAPPLVRVTGGRRGYTGAEVILTDTGRAVLEGSAAAHLGEEQIGGVVP